MTKSLKRAMSVFFAALFSMTLYAVSANAAEDEAEITVASDDDGTVSANVGDTVKYAIYVSDCAEDVVGVDMSLFYSTDVLELDADSVEFENFSGVVSNPDLDGYLRFNWTSVTDPVRPSADKAFVSAEFKVKSAANGSLSYFVSDMYGEDMTYLKSYKITCTVWVNGKEAFSSKVPVVNEDGANENKLQGDFINYVDGRGQNDVSDSNRETVIVEKKYITTEIVDVTKSSTSEGGSTNTVTFAVIAAVVVVLLAAAAVIIVKRRDDINRTENEKK